MRIVALDLENTKSYQQGRVEFTDGVNAIVGHNGAGKSTILEAIGFTLFDFLTNGYKQSDFVREGAKTATITVTMVSGLDERSYQIIRRCGASNQYYIFDPELQVRVCDGKNDVHHFLRQHMGVEPNADLARLFTDAVGVPQGTFTAAFLNTPAQRKGIFDPLLQVEEYKQAFDKLLEPLRTLQQQQQALDVEMAGFVGRLERLPILEGSLTVRAETLQRVDSEQRTVQQNLTQVLAERSTLDAHQAVVVECRTHEQQAIQQRERAIVAAENASKAEQEAAAAAELVAQQQAGYTAYLQAQSEQQQLEAQAAERQKLERRRATLDKERSVAQAQLDGLARDLAEVATATAQVAALTPQVTAQEGLETALRSAEQQSLRLEESQKEVKKQETAQSRLQARLQTLTAQLAQALTLDAERAQAEAQVETQRGQIDECKETLARYKAEADARKEQSTALANVATALCPVCEQPLSPQEREALQRRNDERLATLRNDYRNQQQTIKSQEALLQQQQEQLKGLEQRLRAMPRAEEAHQLESELTATSAALAAAQQEVVTLTNAPATVTTLRTQLQALGDPRQQRAVAAATAGRRATLEAQQQQQLTALQQSESELTTLQSALAQFSSLDGAREQVATVLAQTAAAYQLVLRHQQLAERLPERQLEVSHTQATLIAATTAVTTAQAALAAAEAQFDNVRHQQLLAEEQTLRSRLGSLQTQLALLQQEQTREEQELAQLRQQQQQLVALQTQRETLVKQAAVLEALRNLLRQAGPYITKALIKQISDGAAQIFSDLMQDFTRHLRWGEDYGVTLEVDGRERQFAQLSGGEQMSAALAVRLALLREMSNIDVAFFDEPTTNLDETRRDALARQILDVKGFRQLFVISHDDTFEQATQNIIRIARVNGASVVLQP